MEFDKLYKKMFKSIIIIIIIELLVGISISFYMKYEIIPIILGIILGGILSIFKVLLLVKGINKSLENKKTANINIATNNFLRFILTGIVLYIGATSSIFNLWGVVAGVFAFQVAAFTLKKL